MLDPQYLLGDEEMQQFIAEGYLSLKSSLPASLHQDIYPVSYTHLTLPTKRIV